MSPKPLIVIGAEDAPACEDGVCAVPEETEAKTSSDSQTGSTG